MGFIESDGRGLRNSILALLLTAIFAAVLSGILVGGILVISCSQERSQLAER